MKTQHQHIQPNLLRPCSQAFAARLHLFRFRHAESGREWLNRVTTRMFDDRDDIQDRRFWLNVSFTFEGLRQLGVDPLELSVFPEAFRSGMAKRRKQLGDPEGVLDPNAEVPHVALLVLSRIDHDADLQRQLLDVGEALQQQCMRDSALSALTKALAEHLDGTCGAAELVELTQPQMLERIGRPIDLHQPIVRGVDQQPAAVEYFGFRDGLSQPDVYEGDGLNPQLIVAANSVGPTSLLADGTFMAVRKLQQDPVGFWDAMKKSAASSGFATPEELAEFLIGRRRDGRPLGNIEPAHATSNSEYAADPTTWPAFVHAPEDEQTPPACPFQSHVRRMNPRFDPALTGTAGAPRLLRRGMSYHDGDHVGLMFMAFNADLERQFEFIQRNWVQHGNHIGGLSDHRDPLASQAGTSGGCLASPTFVSGRRDGPPVSLHLPMFVTLRWGEYFFVPARPALERICQSFSSSAARQQKLAPALPDAIAWINDPQLARCFWNEYVPDQGLRIGQHVFVKDPTFGRAILADPQASHGFSVAEYGRRLRSISGPFVLGMDVDSADYRRESALLRVIPRSLEENRRIRAIAKSATSQLLQTYVRSNALRDVPETLLSRNVIAVALSAVWGSAFGLPGPGRGSLLMWAQEITDAVFRQGPDGIKLARAELTGEKLRGYVLDRIVEVRGDPKAAADDPLTTWVAQFNGFDDDDVARIITGILVGGVTAVAGTFVPGLARWALQANNDNLAESLRAVAPEDGEPWPLYRALARALEIDQLGGPDYLYRSYRGGAARTFTLADGREHVQIQKEDTVVVWIGGAARVDDTPATEIRFGAGEHMCPGAEMARAIIDGILAALGDCRELRRADARGLEFTIGLDTVAQTG